ncbi:hypothetical protein Ac2012v2_007896 [Leucoagaricus gongylophorus]
MVRLVTHNLLACHAKDCNANNFPLIFQNVRLEIREAEFNSDFIKTFLPKIEWNSLVKTARELGDTSLPDEQPGQPGMIDDEFLKNLHHVLFELHVVEGAMACPNCKHVYPISDGIPNMLLTEHEIS